MQITRCGYGYSNETTINQKNVNEIEKQTREGTTSSYYVADAISRLIVFWIQKPK